MPSLLADRVVQVRFTNPVSGPVTLTVFDIAGRAVSSTRSPGHAASGSLVLNLRHLSAGVYLVKLEADGFKSVQKLVIQR